MLAVVASVLAVLCKLMQQLPTMLGPAVHCGKDTSHKTLKTMFDARGPNIVALRIGDHGTKEMLGVVGSKVWPGFKLCATTPNNNNVQQGVTTDVTYNIQQCWKLLANNFNVASVCNGLKNVWVGGNLVKQDHLRVDQEYFTSIHPIFSILPWTSRCNGRTALC